MPRFSLRSLLAAFALILFLGVGLWFGQLKHRPKVRLLVAPHDTRSYYIGDLALRKISGGVLFDASGLIHDIKKNVTPEAWQISGGTAAISEFAVTQSLIIHHDADGHDQVARYLTKRRAEQSNKP